MNSIFSIVPETAALRGITRNRTVHFKSIDKLQSIGAKVIDSYYCLFQNRRTAEQIGRFDDSWIIEYLYCSKNNDESILNQLYIGDASSPFGG